MTDSVRRAVVADEYGEDRPVSGVEKQVGLRGVVEVRLAEDERHSEQVAVVGDRVRGVRPPDRDVVGSGGVDRALWALGGD
jgi:hypothetical protein